MIKKFKNPFFAGALALMLVSVLGGCNGDATLKLDPTIVAGPSMVTTIEGNDTQKANVTTSFKVNIF